MRVGEELDVGGRFVEPVQLQVVCRSLWESLPADATTITETDVKAFGDVDTVLGQFYDAAVNSAASAAHVRERRLRAKLEDDFITSIGTRGTVYLQDWKKPSRALDELEDRHVVHAEFRAGTQWYELTHDRLIDPIRESNRRLRRRRARRLIGAGAAVTVAALAAAVAVIASIGGTPVTAKPGPATNATNLIRSTTSLVGETSELTITVLTDGGIIDPSGGTAIARILSGPGAFAGRPTCRYRGGSTNASCAVHITSELA